MSYLYTRLLKSTQFPFVAHARYQGPNPREIPDNLSTIHTTLKYTLVSLELNANALVVILHLAIAGRDCH